MEALAEQVGITDRNVRIVVNKLIKAGHLSARKVGRGRLSKLRELTLEWRPPDDSPRPDVSTGHEPPRHDVSSSHESTMTGQDILHDRSKASPRHDVSSSMTGRNDRLLSSDQFKNSPDQSAPSPSPAETAGSAAPGAEAEAAAAPPQVCVKQEARWPEEKLREHAEWARTVPGWNDDRILTSYKKFGMTAEHLKPALAVVKGNGESAAAPEAGPPGTVSDGWCLTLGESASVVSVSTVTLH
jgi:hypothetical protein